MTTTDDVFDLHDGEISLREAVWYAGEGERVTFDIEKGPKGPYAVNIN